MNKDLIKEVESLIKEVEATHRYSMSKIYGAYNKVFDKNEQPQACASCLIRKVRELKQWKEKQELESKLKESEAMSSQSRKIIKETDKKSAKKINKES